MEALSTLIIEKLGLEQGEQLINYLTAVQNNEDCNQFIIFAGSGNEGKSFLLRKIETMFKSLEFNINVCPYGILCPNKLLFLKTFKFLQGKKITITFQDRVDCPSPDIIKSIYTNGCGLVFIETNFVENWKTFLEENPDCVNQVKLFLF